MREIKIQKRSEFAEFVDAISKVNDSVIITTTKGESGTLSSIVRDADLLKRIAIKALDILHPIPLGTNGTLVEVVSTATSM